MLETLLFLLVVSALANWQAVETYHHSSLFLPVRARLEAMGGFWDDLTSCPYCLSHWTGALLSTLSLVLAQRVCAAPVDWWLGWPLFTLSVTRLSNLANDLTHRYCRTPRGDQAILDVQEELNNLTK